jgi:hypothetical protein
MKRFTASPGYARAKLVNAVLFVGLGVFIVAQIVHGVGWRLEAIPGIALGVALAGLGAVRLIAAARVKAP